MIKHIHLDTLNNNNNNNNKLTLVCEMWKEEKRKLSSPMKEDLGVEVIALLESVILNCSIKLTTHYD